MTMWGCHARWADIFVPAESYVVVPPAEMPTTREFVKTMLGRLDSDLDQQFDACIAAATGRFETYLKRAIVRQTREIRLDRFYDAVRLPFPDHAADAIVSVGYVAAGGANAVVDPAAYHLTGAGSRTGAVLRLATGGAWPAVAEGPEAVLVRYVAGYAPDGDDLRANIPEEIPVAISHYVGGLLEFRERLTDTQVFEVPGHCFDLLDGLKARWL